MSSLNGSQSVDRALALLSLVGRHAGRGASLSTLVEESGLNKPTARRLLLALIRAGLVEQDAKSRRYYPGEESYVLGMVASQRFGLVELCRDSLTRLSRVTEDTSFISVRRGLNSVCLWREEGTYPVRTHALQVGFEHPLGVGAGSLALLAALGEDEAEQIIAANTPVLLEKYPGLPPDLLRRDLADARMRGYALNPGRIFANSWGVGVAICDQSGQPAGALSIAAIDSRMQEGRQTELAVHLKAEAGKVEARMAAMFARRNRTADKPTVRVPVSRNEA